MKDIRFNSQYGDFSITSDLEITTNNNTRQEIILDRIKSGVTSYRLTREYTASLDRYVGKEMSLNNRKSMKDSIIYALTGDNFSDKSSLKVIILETKEVDTLYIRVEELVNEVPTVVTSSLNIGET